MSTYCKYQNKENYYLLIVLLIYSNIHNDVTLSLLFQSQPDMAGHAAPDSINLQEEQPIWPLPEAPLEVQWGGAGVQPPVRLRSTRCRCHGWSGTEMEATAWTIPLHGRKCQERDVIAFSFSLLYIPIYTREFNIRVSTLCIF